MRGLLITLIAITMLASLGHAGTIYYVYSSQSGAQTQEDVNHTTVWYAPGITPPANSGSLHFKDVPLDDFDPTFDWSLGGFILDMKSGGTNVDAVLTLWDGSIGGTPVTSVSVPGTSFSHSFALVDFTFSNAVTMEMGHQYIATLTSAANTTDGYFIKPDSSLILNQLNGTGPQAGGIVANSAAVPEPGTVVLMATGVAGLLMALRKRRS